MASKNRLRPLARAVMRTQSDERLVTLARDGHDAAFEEIVRRYRPPLVAFASAYVAAHVAEDVVQESFENSWKSLLTTESEINLKPWLYAIVRNRALNAKRDARPHGPIDEQISASRTVQDTVLERDELDRVLVAVAALAPAQRKALVASTFEGRTHEQIAEALDTSPASVRGLIHRARSTVRDGVGLLVPLPVVRAISEVASDPAAAEAAVGGATLGIAGAGGAAAGGGLATKTVTIIAAATVAAGAGVAVEESLRDEDRTAAALSEEREGSDRRPAHGDDSGGAPPAAVPVVDDDSSGPGPSGEDDGIEDGRESENSGPGSLSSGPGSVNSGPGSVNSGSDDADAAESDDSSGSGSGSSGSDSSGSGSSGSDGSGSFSSGSGSSGSDADLELEEPVLDSSGPGSGLELEPDSSGSGG